MSTEIKEAIEPFDHEIDGAIHRVGVVDKHNPRYYFYHPFLKTPEGKWKKISKYTRTEIIAELELAYRDRIAKLTRAEYVELAAARNCLMRISEELEAPHILPEDLVTRVSPSVVYKYCYQRKVKLLPDWNARAAQQRKEERALAFPTQTMPQPKRSRMPWEESQAKFLRLLWTVGMAQIATDNDCAPCTVRFHAEKLKLPHPGRGYFTTENPKIPDEILERIKELEIDEAKVAGSRQAARDAGGDI